MATGDPFPGPKPAPETGGRNSSSIYGPSGFWRVYHRRNSCTAAHVIGVLLTSMLAPPAAAAAACIVSILISSDSQLSLCACQLAVRRPCSPMQFISHYIGLLTVAHADRVTARATIKYTMAQIKRRHFTFFACNK